jgi:hypothetical protein
MSDQPSDHDDMVADHEPTSGDGHDHPPTDHSTTPAWVSMEIAADTLGITVNAVRQRIKRGTLIGVKTDDVWSVDMVATNQESGTDRPTTRPTNHATIPTDQRPTIDLSPLADVIRDQNRRLEELSSSAAFWQVRALQAEDQLKQLTAGTTPPTTPSEAPGSPRTNDQPVHGLRAWWRRLWGF